MTRSTDDALNRPGGGASGWITLTQSENARATQTTWPARTLPVASASS